MSWGRIYRRRLKVFAVALTIYLDYKLLQKRQKWVKKPRRDVLWKKAHERNAQRVLKLIVELKGLWVKLGQYLSTRADVLPMAYIYLLRQLQDSLPPRPLHEVVNTICRELNKSMEDVFLNFDTTPLATASIAQVHRATITNGREVVVKVQHQGIAAVILEDLKNAKSIIEWIAWAEPQYNFKPVIDEWCKEAPKELDFNLEAENTRSVSRNLCCKSKDEPNISSNKVHVLIPEVIQSTEKLLILEYMDGIRLNDSVMLEAYGVDRRTVVEEIIRAYAHQIYVDGFFNGDPHPGNFLIGKERPHCPILLDFGLTKLLPMPTKRALAKMLLSTAEGNQVALLSSFAEMGLKLRLDMPEQAMDVTTLFFRASTPPDESSGTLNFLSDQRAKGMKALQEKLKLSDREIKRFNPIDAFPGDIVIFGRVLNLLRGLSSMMNVRVAYLDIMRPFAESILQRDAEFMFKCPVRSDMENRLSRLLIELANDNKILGIQVCAYKDGTVIIDSAAGVLGRYDPRPVQPDTLFPVFSATKGVTAGMLHRLVDSGKLKLDENVANIWPPFGCANKQLIKVHHVLNHTSGLHNALGELTRDNPQLLSDWDQCLEYITSSIPETQPGQAQLYHYLSFGWLCGGIIENASGKRFQEVLEESLVHPLGIEGELYIGIPPGVESRLASLSVDSSELHEVSEIRTRPDLPATFQPDEIAKLATTLPVLFNTLSSRRAVIPAANGHCSARALARYYACLADGGVVPPPHSASEPPLGSHPHIPAAASQRTTASMSGTKLFSNARIVDAFLGVGEYAHMALPGGKFGLGFTRFASEDGSFYGFGHAGIGGSMGYCDVRNRFSIAVTVNQMSMGSVTRRIVQFVCSELGLPFPQDFARTETGQPNALLIN